MRRFHDASIRTKLVVLTAGLVSFIVLLVCAAFVINSVRSIRSLLIARHAALADAIATDSPLAVIAQDRNLGEQILAPLNLSPAVEFACLLDSGGQAIAWYPVDAYDPANPAAASLLPAAGEQGLVYSADGVPNEQDKLELFRPIDSDGQTIGTVFLRVRMDQVNAVLRRDIVTAGLVWVASLVGVVLLAAMLQRIITNRIVRLSAAAKAVSDEHDYSIRVSKLGADELGTLADGFNDMLTAIAERDAELARHRSDLESLVAERTAELQREQYLLNALVDTIPDPVFFKDREGRFIRVNRAMAADAGVDEPSELIGKTDADIWTGDLAAETAADERNILETGQPLINKEEQPINERGEARWVLVTKMPLLDEQERITGIFGVARDITVRKQQELERERQTIALARAKEALERSNRDLQQFAYVASHDLQEPLRAVAGYCQLLELKLSDHPDEELTTYLRHATEGAKRMQNLINSLLAYARIETRGKTFVPTDMRLAVEDAIADLRTAIEESGAVITVSDLPTVPGDRDQLARVFQNLISNAIKFRGPQPLKIEISAAQDGTYWRFSVRDNGIGLDEEYAGRIFVIFQRLHTRTAYAGTGLGLAISKRVIERHGGTIWVESKLGNGSTFWFTLPRSED